ncbi:unnamed protein product [Thelazia callipaeda]|uniref:Bestrophin homolog n=1 Tax=Thelazia callipaeda TaxID=103827 RepID=A0A0N5D6C7_THECL|nr:unnamed protein product [Thelazia callipaeda]
MIRYKANIQVSRYTTTEAPITLITQLMLPLITWQIILGISFFPEEFITYFLDEMYGNDEAAGDQPIFHQPTNLDNLHSHGDVPPTPIAEQISYDFFF